MGSRCEYRRDWRVEGEYFSRGVGGGGGVRDARIIREK